MLQYIKNIIPRIQQFSGQLSHIESFVDKPWVLIDEDQNTHEYLFLRDHRLILSLNGKAIEGKWELLPTGKLLINRVSDQIVLQHAFIDEGILLLKMSGGDELPFMLINEKVIIDRDPVKYLRTVEATKLNYELYETPDGILINNSNSSTGDFQIGSKITYENGVQVNGELRMHAEPDLRVIVKEGIIEERFFIQEYATVYGIPLIVKCKQRRRIMLGDFILNHADLPSHTHKNIFPIDGYYLIETDSDGKVTKINEDNMALVIWLVITILIILIGIILLGTFNS